MTPLLTAAQVAALLVVHPNHVYHLAASRQIESVVVGRNRRRFTQAAVEAFIEDRRVARVERVRCPASPTLDD